jgi:predicted Zn-dependent peptidase
MENKFKLANGMRVHLVPFAGTDAVTALVLVNVGSRYEALPLWGASHFIEHMMFKGTTRRPETIDISKALDRYGAQYNAYTGKDLTGYYVRIDAAHTEVAVDLLHDMLYHSVYDADEMEKEKKVIIEEIKMYDENPVMNIDSILERGLFEGNTLGRDIAGTADSMRAMNREDVIAYRDTHYDPRNVVIVISGAVPANIQAILDKTFGTVAAKEGVIPLFENTTLFEATKEQFVVQTKKDVEQVQLGVGFRTGGRHSEDRYAGALLATLMGGMMSSKLFVEIREKRGLCYSVSAGFDMYDEIGSWSVFAGLDGARMDEASKAIFEELHKIVGGIKEDELAYVKDHLAGGMKLSLENSSKRAEFIGRQELFYSNVLTPEEVFAKYQAITLQELETFAAKYLTPERLAVAAIGPYNDTQELASHIHLS